MEYGIYFFQEMVGKLVKPFLEKSKYHIPPFAFCTNKAFNGIVIDVDEDDIEEFEEFFERNGFICESDKDEETTIKSTPKTSLHIP